MTPDEPTAVYLAYDRNGHLLYVGITLGFTSRMGHHRNARIWWPEVARLDIEHHPNRPAALAREKEVIDTLAPPYNATAHSAWRQRDHRIVSYRQDGWTNKRIATAEGISLKAVERTIKRLIREGRIQPRAAGRRKTEIIGASGQHAHRLANR